jgi:uncharacterized membrane protein (DUF485 family)
MRGVRTQQEELMEGNRQQQPSGGMQAREIIESPEFRALVKKRWTVSVIMLVLLFLSYYGYILLIGADRELVSRKIGTVTTLAIPLGVASIFAAWSLTGVYVWWANRKYDPEVERLKGRLHR